MERFRRTSVAYSDSGGRFRLRGVAERTALTIRAVSEDESSDAVDVVLPPKQVVELRLVSRTTARPAGRVVDMNGGPIADVEVAIQLGRVFQKEHFGREELMPVALYQQAVLAPARIDPEWSVEVVNRLCSGTLQPQSTDQLELRSAMTGALTASPDDRP